MVFIKISFRLGVDWVSYMGVLGCAKYLVQTLLCVSPLTAVPDLFVLCLVGYRKSSRDKPDFMDDRTAEGLQDQRAEVQGDN